MPVARTEIFYEGMLVHPDDFLEVMPSCQLTHTTVQGHDRMLMMKVVLFWCSIYGR